MSTNSLIGFIEDGKETSIYCHWDGYVSNNGTQVLSMMKYVLNNSGEGCVDIFKNSIKVLNLSGDYFGSFGNTQIIDFRLDKETPIYLSSIHVNQGRDEGNSVDSSDDYNGYKYIVNYDDETVLIFGYVNKKVISFDEVKSMTAEDMYNVYVQTDVESKEELDEEDKTFLVSSFNENYNNFVNNKLCIKENFKKNIFKGINILNNSEELSDITKEYEEILQKVVG